MPGVLRRCFLDCQKTMTPARVKPAAAAVRIDVLVSDPSEKVGWGCAAVVLDGTAPGVDGWDVSWGLPAMVKV